MPYLLVIAQSGGIDLATVAQLLIILYFSISFHEAAHAWMAYRCGDDTARLMGRMTLNPIVHIDPIGTVLIPIVMIVFSPGFAILGWGKPCPVNPLNFRNYRRDDILVSLAGPASNFIIILACVLIVRTTIFVAGHMPNMSETSASIALRLLIFVTLLARINVILAIFNLIPIPPLDGSHILKHYLPPDMQMSYERFGAMYGWIVLIIAINIRILDPLFHFGFKLTMRLLGI